jgi:hypothetical protein
MQDIKKRVSSKDGPTYKVAGPAYSRQGRINIFPNRYKKAQAGIWLGKAEIGLNPTGSGLSNLPRVPACFRPPG